MTVHFFIKWKGHIKEDLFGGGSVVMVGEGEGGLTYNRQFLISVLSLHFFNMLVVLLQDLHPGTLLFLSTCPPHNTSSNECTTISLVCVCVCVPECYANLLFSTRGWIFVSAESTRFHIIVRGHGRELGHMPAGKWFSSFLEVCFLNCRNYWPGPILDLNVINANVGFVLPVVQNVIFFECGLSAILKWNCIFRECSFYNFLWKWRSDPDIEQESVSCTSILLNTTVTEKSAKLAFLEVNSWKSGMCNEYLPVTYCMHCFTLPKSGKFVDSENRTQNVRLAVIVCRSFAFVAMNDVVN